MTDRLWSLLFDALTGVLLVVVIAGTVLLAALIGGLVGAR